MCLVVTLRAIFIDIIFYIYRSLTNNVTLFIKFVFSRICSASIKEEKRKEEICM
jgi:hypothetical protein